MKHLLRILPLLVFLSLAGMAPGMAQNIILQGRVVDAETRDALAFVSLQANDGPDGCISDIDGKFTLTTHLPLTKINVTYIGYEPLDVAPDFSGKEMLIRIRKTAYELPQIVIKPGINPAHRILREVIANRYLNDHEHLPSFSYTSYEKTIFGPESDSIPPIDSLASDSSYIKARQFFDRQHLLMMESVVKRSFRFPADNYNKVIASRVSGLSDPLFVFLVSQLQSTSFYRELITIADKNYVNPVSPGCFSKYYFELQDTLIEPYPYDTTYVISYRPLLNTNFDGLQGQLSISTNGYAIRNVIARPSRDEGLFNVKIQQLYDYADSSHWFPVQLNTDILFKNSTISIDSTNKTTLKMMGRSKSYISDINLNPALKRSQFSDTEIDILPEAYRQSEKVWAQYRTDTLSSRDLETYRVIDSIGKANNFDRMTRRLGALLSGRITVGYMDIYLDYLFKVNHHEGFRPGLKLTTSDKVSRRFRIGGYGAYGLHDKQWKYGAEAQVLINRNKDFRLNVSFSDDVNEAGADPGFGQERNLLNPARFREILVERMDHIRCWEASANSRTFKYLTLGTGLSVSEKIPLYTYSYINAQQENILLSSSDFRFSEISLTARYAYGEKFMKNAKVSIPLGTNYPVIQFCAIRGISGFLGGQYTYNRFDLNVSKVFHTRFLGTTSFSLDAGLIDRDIPYVNLYNARAAYRPFTLYCPGSFATMRMDEFASDAYATLFVSHNFGKLLFRAKHFKPEPEIVTNMGFGSLRHPENHQGENLKSFGKGYFESGLVINSLLKLGITKVGVAAFYRYGPYALPTAEENTALKIVFQFLF
jgi:hypothetical protein